MAEVTMPRLSDTMEEGTIASWLKKPGEQISKGEVIAQIETDKATMDLTAFEGGTLQEILAPEGTTVAIGQPVARIGSGQAAAAASTPPAATQPTPADDQLPAPGDEVPTAVHADASSADAQSAPDEQHADPITAEPAGNAQADGKVRASPMARHIASEHGLDLSAISGSGPQGRVIRADVEAALDSKPSADAPGADADDVPRASLSAGEDDEKITLSQMRRTIARRMAESTRTVPHFFLTTTVDASDMVVLRKQILEQTVNAGVKITFNDMIVKAVALAIRKVPEVNVSFAEDSLIHHNHVHIGVAVATERGLIVPVVRDVDHKSLSQIAAETRDLAQRASAGKLQPADYTGGTFTVSNLGMFGVEQFSAVINLPEAAILAVGAIVREPAEHQGQIVLRDRLRLTLSVDHRALDGAIGARYLQALKQLLERPMLLLL
ncbi:MAG: dihydrolipoamide acetyltransferase family protein [Chloroflexota bacterium]